MKKITDFEQYTKLFSHFQQKYPDMIYNHVMLPGEFSSAIEKNKLFYEMSEEVLIFYVKEKDFYKLYFFISEKAALTVSHKDKPQLIECIYSARRPDPCVQKMQQKLLKTSFVPYVENKRIRSRISESPAFSPENSQLKKDLFWRFACDADMARLYELWKGMDIYNSTIPEAEELHEFIQNQEILCACQKDQICGVVRLKMENKKTGSIWLVAVDPHFRRQGIATELYKLSFSVLKDRGCTRAIEWCDETNKAVLSLSEQLGFQFDGIKSNSYILK